MSYQHAVSGQADGTDESISRDVSRNLILAIHHAGIFVYYQDAELRVVWAHNVPASWQAGCRQGASDSDFLPKAEAEQLSHAKQRVLASGARESCEISLPGEAGIRWFDIWLDGQSDSHTGAAGVLTTAVETTEHKQREQTLKSLLREVSHRSKNLLAIIQSIATQTGRYSGTIEGFLARFRGRLQSLAASQDLVTLSNWRGADLKELIANQVGRYASSPRENIRFDGDNPYLNPNAALHFGLALHELAVNSMSYGALSRPDGKVLISAQLGHTEEGQRSLTLGWREMIPPTEPKSVEKRFGSVALERVVPASLRGTAELAMGGGELNYKLVVPAGTAGVE